MLSCCKPCTVVLYKSSKNISTRPKPAVLSSWPAYKIKSEPLSDGEESYDLNVVREIDYDPIVWAKADSTFRIPTTIKLENRRITRQKTKLINLDPGLAPYQPDSPQGSVTQKQSIAVKLEVPNNPVDPQIPIQVDGPGPSSRGSPFVNNAGVYGFDLYFQETKHPTKNIPWTYSKQLDKLYASVNTSCPFNFVYTSRPPFGCVIRAVLYFKEPVDIQHPVTRCPAHREKQHPSNLGFEHPDHLIRCSSLDACYELHPVTKRFSVITPYKDPDPTMKYSAINYSFMCYSSCYGINRRSTVIVFTLEHGDLILGQKVVEVRICACPGRDRGKDEKKFQCKIMQNSQSNAIGERISLKRPNQSAEATKSMKCDPPNKKCKENDELVTVSVQFEVRGRLQAEIYQGILNSIKDSAIKNYL